MTAPDMEKFLRRLGESGARLSPLQQAGVSVELTWDAGTVGPILGDDLIVVFPDMHLATFTPGDIFRGIYPGAQNRLMAILNALVAVRPEFPVMSVLQLGDLYDVWRAYPEYKDHPTSDYRRIEDAYGPALGILTQDLQARVCVGNHDASLGLFPPSWARTPSGRVTDQIAYGHRFSSGRVLAFHGHQEDTIDRAMQAQGGNDFVKIATEVSKLMNPIVQIVEEGIDLLEDFFGDTPMALTDALTARWPGAEPPPDGHGFSSPRWCDRGGRDILQQLVGALPGASALRLIMVGHSHRPGISAIHVEGRLVPLVDVGSWVWGRSQIAIASEGRIAMYALS